MPETIAGIEVPASAAATEATALIRETTGALLYDHSRRVFFLASLHARLQGLEPDPELLYLASMFHDSGLLRSFSEQEQRFEIDGADHAQAFLRTRGFSADAVATVWQAIALHTTPGIPGRMDPEVAAMNLGVLTDAVGIGLDAINPAAIDEITAAHPRGEFKAHFLDLFYEGLKNRPDTVYGTINADVLAHFDPQYVRGNMVERVRSAGWGS